MGKKKEIVLSGGLIEGLSLEELEIYTRTLSELFAVEAVARVANHELRSFSYRLPEAMQLGERLPGHMRYPDFLFYGRMMGFEQSHTARAWDYLRIFSQKSFWKQGEVSQMTYDEEAEEQRLLKAAGVETYELGERSVFDKQAFYISLPGNERVAIFKIHDEELQLNGAGVQAILDHDVKVPNVGSTTRPLLDLFARHALRELADQASDVT